MPPQKSLSGCKILYIEDDPGNTALLQRILEAEGYCFSSAPNGPLGLIRAYQDQPDLILLDLYMPGLNGHDLARQLRHMDQTKDIPIIIVSASHRQKDMALSRQLGCRGYISKPIDVDQFPQQMAALL